MNHSEVVPVYFSLGSNMGDRRASILEAVRMMGETFSAAEGVLRKPVAMSSLIETEPWGFESEGKFLNCAVRFDLGLAPHDVLRAVKGVERRLGRDVVPPRYDNEGRRIYMSRPIDIDILLYGSLEIDTPELTVPHPRMYERDFVLIPLREILPI